MHTLGDVPRSKPPRRPRKGPTPPQSLASGPNLGPDLAELITGSTSADLQQLFGQLMSATPFGASTLVPSRRRPRREDVVTYRIRVDLDEAKPPIWRRLELASDVTLDQLHDIVQAAMGWTDSHLHEFAKGDNPTDRRAEHYRPQESLDNDLPGVDEVSVRLDEVLVEPGDRLFYNYDFGDDWSHTLRLEAVSPREPEQPRAACLAGARVCPPEDCGGIWRYHDLLRTLSQPADADNEELLEWVGPDFDPGRFDVAEVNSVLAEMDRFDHLHDSVLSSVDPASPLGDLLARMEVLPAELVEAIEAARQPSVEPGIEAKSAMLERFQRLLDQVGDAGITLTQAGYLPPAHVEAVADILRLEDSWIGKNNREVQTYPVLEFRESAQRLGLLRKAHNRLTLTKAATRARTDVNTLWHLVTGGLPLGLTTRGPEARASLDAGLLLLIGVAAGAPRAERTELVAECLDLLGWRQGPFAALSDRDVQELLGPTEAVLEHVGAIPRKAYRDPTADGPPDPAGAAFARATLGL